MVFACSLLLAAIASSQAGATDIRQLPIDELISRLSPAGCEREPDSKGFVLRPADEELHRRIEAGLQLTGDQWERALRVTEVIRSRSRWPPGVPFAVSMHAPRWLDRVLVRAVPATPGLKPIRTGVDAAPRSLLDSDCGMVGAVRALEYEELGTLNPGKQRILFDVTVEDGVTPDVVGHGSRGPVPGLLIWHGSLAIDVEVVETLEQAMPSRSSAELDTLVRRSLYRTSPADTMLTVGFEAEPSDLAVVADTAFSLVFELTQDGRPIGSGRTFVAPRWGLRPCPPPSELWGAETELDGGSLPVDAGANPSAGMVLQVRGVSTDVLRHWGAKAWWNGTVSIPLTDLPVHR